MSDSSVTSPPRSGRFARWTGNLLIGFGLLLLVGVGGTWAYSQYVNWQAERERQEFIRTFPTAVPARPTEPPATLVPAAAPTQAAGAAATATPAPTSTPAIPAWVTAPPPLRIAAPAIDLDSRVVVSEIQDGTWDVPKFVAGYLDGTGRPARDGGNVALSGHVQSLTSGNVFARIGELKTGDPVVVWTAAGRFEYTVTKQQLVAPEAVEVTYPTDDPRITLITCTGDWDPIKRDYTQRLIVYGQLTSINGEPAG